MGRLTSDFRTQGPMKYVRPIGQRYVEAKCAYCGRYGALGNCVSCGAADQPVIPALPAQRPSVVVK